MVKTRSEKDTSSPLKEAHLITGGAGYIGLKLGLALRNKGYFVVLFDVQPPQDPNLPDGIVFLQGDIRNINDIIVAAEGVACIYHMASYGMSGREQLNKRKIEEVNINGTENIIKVCTTLGIERVVYTSTYNVIFGGQVIENGDESLPYLPLDQHPDNYSRTKSIAEQSILKANGRATVDTHISLKTCALRLAGVYGPGERRHLPRIMYYVQSGLSVITYGAKESKVDYIHVDNVVHAHILAAEALTDKCNNIAVGEAYFISDDKPINNFEFFKPMYEALGYKYPRFQLRLPLSIVYFIAFLIEMIHSIIGRLYNFQPLLTRTEVYKTGVTHYFSIEKARNHLGYIPVKQNSLQDVIKWLREHGYQRQKQGFVVKFLLDVLLAFIFICILMSFLPSVI